MSVLTRWQGKLRTRLHLLIAARKRGDPTAIRLREHQVTQARRVIAHHHVKVNQTTTFDGTPVFTGHALMLQDAREHGWKGTLNSADRRQGIAEKYGKLSQAALWAGWLAHQAGFNPANPPGRSTHELRSDGVAYRGPIGRPLAWWQLGLDTTQPEQLHAILNSLHYKPFKPYPSGSEAHHTNLRASPTKRLRRRGLA